MVRPRLGETGSRIPPGGDSEERADYGALTVLRLIRSGEQAGGFDRRRDTEAEQRLSFALDDRIEVSRSASLSLKGRVVWVNADACGIAFDGEADVRSAPDRGTRHPPGRDPADRGTAAHLPAIPSLTQPAAEAVVPEERTERTRFRAGLRVKVLMAGGRERRAIVGQAGQDPVELMAEDPPC